MPGRSLKAELRSENVRSDMYDEDSKEESFLPASRGLTLFAFLCPNFLSFLPTCHYCLFQKRHEEKRRLLRKWILVNFTSSRLLILVPSGVGKDSDFGRKRRPERIFIFIFEQSESTNDPKSDYTHR